MSRNGDEFEAPDLPSGENGPRSAEHQAYTGTGTPRSADDGLHEASARGVGDADVDPAVAIGATTSSHPADADGVDINRSGGGGSGGASANDGAEDGSPPATMGDMLGGDPEGSQR